MPGNLLQRGKLAAFGNPLDIWDDAEVAEKIAAGYELGFVPSGQGGVGYMIVDRGDPTGDDFTEGNLTIDGNWHDLALSGLVPTGASWVLLKGYIAATTPAGKTLKLRENGNANAYNIGYAAPQAANISQGFEFFIRMDSTRVIEYAITTGMTIVSMVVSGWVI